MTIRTSLIAAAALASAAALSAAFPLAASAQTGPIAPSGARYIPGPPSGAIDFPEAGTSVPGYGWDDYGVSEPTPEQAYGAAYPHRRHRHWR